MEHVKYRWKHVEIYLYLAFHAPVLYSDINER